MGLILVKDCRNHKITAICHITGKQDFFVWIKKKLSKAKVIFGDVAETAQQFIHEHQPAPIGAIFHDLDFYSSTKASFAVLQGDPKYHLPRIFNYFDDLIGDEIALYNLYTGQLAAIEEYNHAQTKQKFTQLQYLKKYANFGWIHQCYVYHDFEHARYNDFVSIENQQLPTSTRS